MIQKRLPITGFPHLFLAAQGDGPLQDRLLAQLRAEGFGVEAARLVPPDGADGRAVIRAITAAFQRAKAG